MVTESEIVDLVEKWHNSDSTLPLHEYLGMTPEEYADYVQLTGRFAPKDAASDKPSRLTFSAEALSEGDPKTAVPELIRLVSHPSSLVREGAVYGLEGHLEYGNVREILRGISLNDPADGVREAATEAIDG